MNLIYIVSYHNYPRLMVRLLNQWLQLFNNAYAHLINKKTILIGHSLGAVFVLRWLEQASIYVEHAMLIGAFIGEVGVKKFDDINQSFFAAPLEWETIKRNCQQFNCYHGSNDPYVTKDHFDFIASQLNAKKTIIANGGDFGTLGGYNLLSSMTYTIKTNHQGRSS